MAIPLEDYNKEIFYTENLEGLIKEVRIMGKKNGIPSMASFAINGDEGSTFYKSFINSAPDLMGMLSQDIIPDCVNVMFNGFYPVKYDVMEDDLANHSEGMQMESEKEEKKLRRGIRGKRFDLTPAFAKDMERHVDKIAELCRQEGVFFLMCFALKDDGDKTEYREYSYAPKEGLSKLSKDILTNGLKVIREGYTSSVEELAVDIQENSVPWQGRSSAGRKKANPQACGIQKTGR